MAEIPGPSVSLTAPAINHIDALLAIALLDPRLAAPSQIGPLCPRTARLSPWLTRVCCIEDDRSGDGP